jgi:hypothetical protein
MRVLGMHGARERETRTAALEAAEASALRAVMAQTQAQALAGASGAAADAAAADAAVDAQLFDWDGEGADAPDEPDEPDELAPESESDEPEPWLSTCTRGKSGPLTNTDNATKPLLQSTNKPPQAQKKRHPEMSVRHWD